MPEKDLTEAVHSMEKNRAKCSCWMCSNGDEPLHSDVKHKKELEYNLNEYNERT